MNNLVPIYSGESGFGGNPSRYALQVPGVGPVHLVENTIGNEEIINPPVVELQTEPAKDAEKAFVSPSLVPIYSGEIGGLTNPTRYALRVPGLGPVRLVENTLSIGVLTRPVRRTTAGKIRRTISGKIRSIYE